jgi:hypothetical protein
MSLNITDMLDKVASSLESKGYIKEATEIDAISNSIEAYDISEKPLVVKINANSTIQADTMKLISQLKRDIGEAFSLIGGSAHTIHTNSYDQPTDKTKDFEKDLRDELLKVRANLGSADSLQKVDVKSWGPGDYYDISRIYQICLSIIDGSKGLGRDKSSVKARDLLDLIADTYDKSTGK